MESKTEETDKMNISKGDVLFIVLFDVGLFLLVHWWITGVIAGCPYPPSVLDQLMYNCLLYGSIMGMPLFFIFSKTKKYVGGKNNIDNS